jgi:hypothetical protein
MILEDDDEWFDPDNDVEDSDEREAGELAGDEWSIEQESMGSRGNGLIKQRKLFRPETRQSRLTRTPPHLL